MYVFFVTVHCVSIYLSQISSASASTFMLFGHFIPFYHFSLATKEIDIHNEASHNGLS